MIRVKCWTGACARRLREECRARRIKIEHRGGRVYHIIERSQWDRDAALEMLETLSREFGNQLSWQTGDDRLSYNWR